VKYFGADEPGGAETPPGVDLSTEAAIVKTFRDLVNFCRYSGGFLALEGIEKDVEHPVMKKGLELVVDGWEPLLMQSVLEKYRDTYLRKIENQLNMIIEGLDSLASRDIPYATEERLNAYRSDLA
jgi:flagellar motor component MotA